MTIYKLSIVVLNRRDIGGIQNLEQPPKPGDIVYLDDEPYEIIELMELMPPRGNFVYLHATCRPVEKPE
jgi:hypothetical protein